MGLSLMMTLIVLFSRCLWAADGNSTPKVPYSSLTDNVGAAGVQRKQRERLSLVTLGLTSVFFLHSVLQETFYRT